MCLLQPLLHQTLPLTLCLRRVFPCDIAIQILQQMLAGGLELIADQSSRRSQVRKVYFSFSEWVLVRIARCCTSA